MAETESRAMTPFERRRQRWFHVRVQDVILCGGSLRADGVDDGRDWCLYLHRENHPEMYRRDPVMELFLPGMTGHVPEGAEEHLEEADDVDVG